MKKLIILIVCFTLLCGCTKINNDNINNIINSVVSSDNDRANQYRNGYKFYLPNNLSTIKIDDKNNVFKENDIKYFDIYSYSEEIPIVSIGSKYFDVAMLANYLALKNIQTRVGLHCNVMTHKYMSTYPEGTIRFSFSHYNTTEELDITVNVIKEFLNGKDLL